MDAPSIEGGAAELSIAIVTGVYQHRADNYTACGRKAAIVVLPAS